MGDLAALQLHSWQDTFVEMPIFVHVIHERVVDPIDIRRVVPGAQKCPEGTSAVGSVSSSIRGTREEQVIGAGDSAED